MRADLSHATWWTALLDGTYTAIEALDTSGYRSLDHDRWTRARLDGVQREHLETWIGIGDITALNGAQYTLQATFEVVLRQVPGDDAVSQGRILAALFDLSELLIRGWGQTGYRFEPTGLVIEDTTEPEWVRASMTAHLYIARHP